MKVKIEFVTYEQALALKELGFDEPCLATINNYDWLHIKGTRRGAGGAVCTIDVPAPSKSQIFRWFREKHEIEATIACYYSKILGISYEERQYHCHIVRDGITTKGPNFKTYEEAESACIDKLIEIVKNNLDK